MMDIPLDHVRDIHVIAETLIEMLEEQMVLRGVTEGNVAVDAAINCLCYAMRQAEPRLSDDELIRRVAKYYEAMELSGAPGSRDDEGEP